MSSHDASATPGSSPTARPPQALRPLRPLPLRPLSPAHSYPRPSAPRRWLGALGGCLLGGVLLVAVWGKALDPAGFAQQIHADGLDRLLPAGAVALAALALEAGLGMALLLGVRRSWVLAPATVLTAGFLLLNGRTWWLAAHGRACGAAGCGCFGNLVQRTPAEAFWQDLALLVVPLALAFLGRDRNLPRLPPVRTAVAAVCAVAAPVFAWRAPELPLDDLATRLKPGVSLSELCAGGGAGERGGSVCLDTVAPDLGHGNQLVVLDDLDDAALARGGRPQRLCRPPGRRGGDGADRLGCAAAAPVLLAVGTELQDRRGPRRAAASPLSPAAALVRGAGRAGDRDLPRIAAAARGPAQRQ